MPVEKIKDASYFWNDERGADWECGVMVTFKERWTPCLLEASYCERAVLVWRNDSHEHAPSMKIYAIEDFSTIDSNAKPAYSPIKAFYELDVLHGLAYIRENVT